MTVLFIICGVLAVWHLVYENLIATTVRMNLRFKLYALRDELRTLATGHSDDASRQAVSDMESILNNAIRLLHLATPMAIRAAAMEVEKDPQLARKIEQRHEAINKVAGLRSIFDQAIELTTDGCMVNVGGWALYLVPIFITLYTFDTIKEKMDSVLTVRTYELETIAPDMACPA